MGDGVSIHFGYPEAHEDDTERAVRAGLALRRFADDERVRRGEPAAGRRDPASRRGHRGPVPRPRRSDRRRRRSRWRRRDARSNPLVQAICRPPRSRRLFNLADLGPQALAGFAEPQSAWRVLGESGMLSRFEALRSGTPPLRFAGADEGLSPRGSPTQSAASTGLSPNTWAMGC
jgi:hypothetical protein